MIIDIHAHGIFDYEGDSNFIEELIVLMNKNKVDLTGLTLNTGSLRLRKAVSLQKSKGFEKDPYRKHNVYMMNLIQSKKLEDRVFPFFYLPIVKNLVIDSTKFYEKKFKNKKFGYKIHNQELNIDLENLSGFNSERPLIIHPSVDECACPKKIIKFSKTYKGNIDVAHFGKFNLALLQAVKKQKNLFIDSSVGEAMLNALKTNSSRVYHPKFLRGVNSLKSLYSLICDNSSEDKLLFATDYPFCNVIGKGYEAEIETLTKIRKDILQKVAYKNAKSFLNLP